MQNTECPKNFPVAVLVVFFRTDEPYQHIISFRAFPTIPDRYNTEIPLRNPDGLFEGHNRHPRFPWMARMDAVDDAGEGYYSIHALFLSRENCYEITEG
jgi:hypothetical protein